MRVSSTRTEKCWKLAEPSAITGYAACQGRCGGKSQGGGSITVTGSCVKPGEVFGATSSGLLERVKAQDQAAWERLVSLYSPLLYRWCRQAGLQAEDARDIGQEVFTAVARK